MIEKALYFLNPQKICCTPLQKREQVLAKERLGRKNLHARSADTWARLRRNRANLFSCPGVRERSSVNPEDGKLPWIRDRIDDLGIQRASAARDVVQQQRIRVRLQMAHV